MFKVHDADSSGVNGQSDFLDPQRPTNNNKSPTDATLKDEENIYSMNDLMKKSP